jgi:hypothetical protein
MTRIIRIFHRPIWQQIGLAALGLALCAGLVISLPVYAQDGSGNRRLAAGSSVTGTLDSENFAQVYTLAASTGDVISIDVTTDVAELAPVVRLTDENGNLIAQDIDLTTATTASLKDVTMPGDGIYIITVMRGSGAQGTASGTFTLKLSGTQKVGGQMVALDQGGLTISLTWADAVNLNLEVRDPVGGAIHAYHMGSPSGGTLDADVNATCESATANNPTETIAWPVGQVPAGSYEIIVHYVDGCGKGGPQEFTVTANVNNGTAQMISGTINFGQEYLARLIIDPNGSWKLQNSGVNAGLDISLFSAQIAAAQLIALNTTVTGTITNANPAQAYKFDATSGTTVSISIQAQSGSLDTYLVLLGPDNKALVSNDDANENTTNSAIDRNLAVDGTYTIVATRYGLTIGGTEGNYQLTLSTAATGAAATPVGESTAAQANLTKGAIEVTLTWLTNADLQLQVRDPNGQTVYDDLPQIRSGGVLEKGGNMNCENTTTTPIDYIYWPPNRLVPGTYEVEVWYQNPCDDNTPINFGLTVNIQDQTIINTSQPISLDARYLITFKIAQDGTATAGPGGFFDMSNSAVLNYQAMLDTATPIVYGGKVSGSITEQQKFQIYSFEGQQGDVITIGMTATGGTLDTALYLISPEGIQVDFNDDVKAGENSNSVINKATLATTGTYYIIATHYGLNLGGTYGTYDLTLVQE